MKVSRLLQSMTHIKFADRTFTLFNKDFIINPMKMNKKSLPTHNLRTSDKTPDTSYSSRNEDLIID